MHTVDQLRWNEKVRGFGGVLELSPLLKSVQVLVLGEVAPSGLTAAQQTACNAQLGLVAHRCDAILEDVARRLVKLANDWRDEDSKELTQPALKKLLAVEAVHLDVDGDATVYLADGNAFAGHAIEVFLSPGGVVKDAQLAG